MIRTARELVQRAFVRAWGRRRGPVTVRVGWVVFTTRSMMLRSEAVRSLGEYPPRGVRSGTLIKATLSALSSRLSISAIRLGGASGSRLFGVEGRNTSCEERM